MRARFELGFGFGFGFGSGFGLVLGSFNNWGKSQGYLGLGPRLGLRSELGLQCYARVCVWF